jgi:hypothetical protein
MLLIPAKKTRGRTKKGSVIRGMPVRLSSVVDERAKRKGRSGEWMCVGWLLLGWSLASSCCTSSFYVCVYDLTDSGGKNRAQLWMYQTGDAPEGFLLPVGKRKRQTLD